MASKMRKVRRQFRQEMLRAIEAGNGTAETLEKIARAVLGNDIGLEVAMSSFYANEVNKGLAQLRTDGLAESTGKVWKLAGSLDGEDIEAISIRRMKRIKGELLAEIRLAHDNGRFEEATIASSMLAIVSKQLEAAVVEAEAAEVTRAE